jgi:hypothetical protein
LLSLSDGNNDNPAMSDLREELREAVEERDGII